MFIKALWKLSIATLILTGCGEGSYESLSGFSSATEGQENAIALIDKGVQGFFISISTSDRSAELVLCREFAGGECEELINGEFKFWKEQNQKSLFYLPTTVRLVRGVAFSVKDKQSQLRLRTFQIEKRNSGSNEASDWKMILMTGDNEFNAWDNAREKLNTMFEEDGVPEKNILHLSMNNQKLKEGKIFSSSRDNLESTLKKLDIKEQEKCFVFMTSHGSRQGFFLRNKGTITPQQFDGILERTCGNRPTVALVSACYSGVMITEAAKKPNRIILTAASASKTSFGCDARSTYTFFDQCVIESLPNARTWKTFSELNRKCVYDLERVRGMPHNSNPQIYIGSEVENLELPGK